MRDRTEQRVKSWESRPFSDGFAGLRDLADGGFSGVVVAAGSWLFMLNGRVVGIVDGDIDDFEDATGTVYQAPDPSLPLLFSMQERGGKTQAKYYTNDTPLAEADETLSDANFTGFVELSENVLSGDYYLVYYGGRALPVAFVGTSDDLKTGEEAFELADDEVGVYEVVKVPVSVTEVPGGGGSADEDDADETDAASAAAGASAATTAAADAPEDDSERPAEEAEPDRTPEGAGRSEGTSTPDRPSEPTAESSAVDSTEPARDAEPQASEPRETPEPAGSTERADRTAESTDSSPAERSERSTSPREQSAASDAGESATVAAESAREDADGATEDESSVFREEAEWRKTKSIPSLSPSERERRRRERGEGGADASEESRPQATDRSRETSAAASDAGTRSRSRSGRQGDDRQAARSEPERSDASQPTTERADSAAGREQQPTTEADPSQAAPGAGAASGVDEERVTELESRLADVQDERDDLQARLDEVREERDELDSRVAELESALEDAGAAAAAGVSLSPEDALQQTNLFVRYDSKGDPTLEALTGKNPDPDAVNDNLRLDYHTQFEADDASVNGQPFETFLHESSAYRFVNWLVRELPYEILDAGHRSGLTDVYDAIPEIDRVELGGTVEVETDSGTKRHEFDVVLRDRMGNALFVAELNDARDPVSGDEMDGLVKAAQTVGEGVDELGAAFYVTASFFEPQALETAADATGGGGLLSRSDKKSYVKVARKRGFHLCLAEDRNETFNLTVPEL